MLYGKIVILYNQWNRTIVTHYLLVLVLRAVLCVYEGVASGSITYSRLMVEARSSVIYFSLNHVELDQCKNWTSSS